MQGKIDPMEVIFRTLAGPGKDTSDFDLNPGTILAENRHLRPAAVLVPIMMVSGVPAIILTKRSSRLKHHPGQIAFPGGKVDPDDTSPVAAALREAEEEIGLAPQLVDIFGEMAPHETVTGFTVTPILGYVRDGFTPRPEAGEVDEVFSVPLSHLTSPANFRIESRRWRGQLRRYYVVPYGPYYIWGATARILRAMADRMSSA